jgi:hypothetical protein
VITGPLFKHFGSKWLSARTLPPPEHPRIVEPFAGGAGYSLRHTTLNVYLAEADGHVYDLWQWLIEQATEQAIRDIPIDLPEGTDIRSLSLSEGQQLLLKHWQRTNNVGNCWTVSPWGNKPGQWTANTRARVASEFHEVKHWKMLGRDAFFWLEKFDIEATWFIDPSYQFNYQYRQPPVDYLALAALVQQKRGQRIVCEAVCPKTGDVPTWLPFKPFGERVTSRRKSTNNHHSKELLWTSRST